MGTAIWLSSVRASHASTARARAAITFGCTDEIATRTAASNEGGASDPTSQSLTASLGSATRNIIGASSTPTKRRQPRIGLVANPAHRTRPSRFAGFVAAYWIAKGVEKDSATSTSGSETGQATRTKLSNSEYERCWLFGYRTVTVSNSPGRASTKYLNSSPVPSIPGRSTSFTTGICESPRISDCP